MAIDEAKKEFGSGRKSHNICYLQNAKKVIIVNGRLPKSNKPPAPEAWVIPLSSITNQFFSTYQYTLQITELEKQILANPSFNVCTTHVNNSCFQLLLQKSKCLNATRAYADALTCLDEALKYPSTDAEKQLAHTYRAVALYETGAPELTKQALTLAQPLTSGQALFVKFKMCLCFARYEEAGQVLDEILSHTDKNYKNIAKSMTKKVKEYELLKKEHKMLHKTQQDAISFDNEDEYLFMDLNQSGVATEGSNMQDLIQDLKDHLRILFIGPKSCGKTTLLQQMRLIYTQSMSQQECDFYKTNLQNIAMQSIREVASFMLKSTTIEMPEEIKV